MRRLIESPLVCGTKYHCKSRPGAPESSSSAARRFEEDGGGGNRTASKRVQCFSWPLGGWRQWSIRVSWHGVKHAYRFLLAPSAALDRSAGLAIFWHSSRPPVTRDHPGTTIVHRVTVDS